MTPEEIVLQLKKNGTFDELRKKLLSDFQSQVKLKAISKKRGVDGH